MRRDYTDKIFDLGLDNINDGSNWISASCPFHADESPSFGVHKYTGGFNCFSCGVSGSWNYLCILLGVSDTPTVNDLPSKIESFLNQNKREEIVEESPFKPPHDFSVVLPGSPGFKYLLNRGIPPEDIEWFRCGYSFRTPNRVIIPSWTCDMKMDYWVARDYTGNARLRYLTPKGGRPEGTLMNIGRIRELYDNLIIAEGSISAMSIGRNCTCTYSQKFSDDQIERIVDSDFESVTICFDGEPIATKLAEDMCERLVDRVSIVRICELPDGKDPGDLGRYAMQKLIEKSRPYTRFGYKFEKFKSAS